MRGGALRRMNQMSRRRMHTRCRANMQVLGWGRVETVSRFTERQTGDAAVVQSNRARLGAGACSDDVELRQKACSHADRGPEHAETQQRRRGKDKRHDGDTAPSRLTNA